MSVYTLVRRGVIQITSSDGAGPKDVDLSAAVKTGSAFVVARVRDRRRDVLVQAGTIAITDADVGGTKDSAALGTAVDTSAAYVLATVREKRTDDYRGATVKLQSATLVRATFNPPAAGDTIDVDFQVIEHKARRGATLRLLDADTVRAEWDGALAAGETIDIAYDVYDLDDLGDDIKEILYREARILGYLGEFSLRDLLVHDDAGNRITWRVRVFDTQANLEDATVDLPEGDALETGELARYKVTKDISVGENDLQSMTCVRTHLAENPDIG